MPHTKKRSAAVSAIGCLAALTLLAGCGGEAISAGDAKSVYLSAIYKVRRKAARLKRARKSLRRFLRWKKSSATII